MRRCTDALRRQHSALNGHPVVVDPVVGDVRLVGEGGPGAEHKGKLLDGLHRLPNHSCPRRGSLAASDTSSSGAGSKFSALAHRPLPMLGFSRMPSLRQYLLLSLLVAAWLPMTSVANVIYTRKLYKAQV